MLQKKSEDEIVIDDVIEFEFNEENNLPKKPIGIDELIRKTIRFIDENKRELKR